MIPTSKLAEWKALCNLPELDEGPWDFVKVTYNDTDAALILSGPEQTERGEMGTIIARYRNEMFGPDEGDLTSLDDWRFIAAARTGWPEAILALEAAEQEKQQALTDQLEALCMAVCPFCRPESIYLSAASTNGVYWYHYLKPVHIGSQVQECYAELLRRTDYQRRQLEAKHVA